MWGGAGLMDRLLDNRPAREQAPQADNASLQPVARAT
jgi:hypothetical protein